MVKDKVRRIESSGIAQLSVPAIQKRLSFDSRFLLILLMRPARLERATFWFVAKRSIQLSYERLKRTVIVPKPSQLVNGLL